MRVLTTEEYEERIKDKPVECLEKYVNNSTNIAHRCLKCNYIWKARPNNVLIGRYCPKCSQIRRANKFRRSTKEYKELIKNRTIECLDEYISCDTKIKHRCLICGYIWSVRPYCILNGYGCPNCSHRARLTIDGYKKRIMDKGVECLGEYTNICTKIKHRCLKCGYVWDVRPSDVINHHGCPKCAYTQGGIKHRIGTNQYNERIRLANIICIEEYINTRTKIEHKCLVCGCVWKTTPDNILQGCGCPNCASGRRERFCRKIFEEIFGMVFPTLRPRWLRSDTGYLMELDGFCEKLMLAFEHNGIQHYLYVQFLHKNMDRFKRIQTRDALKRELCKQHGVILIEVPYTVKEEDMKNYILSKCREVVLP